MIKADSSVPSPTFPVGRKLRLLGLSAADLPTGVTSPNSLSGSGHESVTPANTSNSASTPDHFIQAILDEALPFIDSASPKYNHAPPSTKWKDRGSKKYTQSDAQVHVTSLVLSKDEIATALGTEFYPQDMENEDWYCRKSFHVDSNKKGTASWEEFYDGFRDNHAEAELGWAPDVVGTRKGAEWHISPNKIFLVDCAGHADRWGSAKMYIVEMKHKLPFPLSERVFPELLVVAERAAGKEFVIVSIPINDMEQSPFAQYSKEKGVVLGRYSSVERIRLGPEGGKIEWIMATASSAEGNIPQWATNAGLYRLVADDVKYFMEYIEKCRKENKDCAGNKKPVEGPLANPELANTESGRKLSLEAAASTAALAGTTMTPSAMKALRPAELMRTESGRMTPPLIPSPQA